MSVAFGDSRPSDRMYFVYSILLSLGFLVMLPLFLLRREKYASGFSQRLGNYPEFKHDERKVTWLHCVSVGETNAARPLVEQLRKEFPEHRLVISTTTRTGQELARKIFADTADAIVYFPFDFKFSVRRAIKRFKPSLVLLMETEIWPRFIREAKLSGAKLAIVNGRLSQRSFSRYSKVRGFVKSALRDVDLALMQAEADAGRIIGLGIEEDKVAITGNLKFDFSSAVEDQAAQERFRRRFRESGEPLFILAASTHDNEESLLLDALELAGCEYRLMIAPRHPERFDEVGKLLGADCVRLSQPETDQDSSAQFILVDTIGDLRNLFGLADIVFVGGSLIRHGGQNVLEPAAAGKAIVVGPSTHNFESIVSDFRQANALIQLPHTTEAEIVMELYDALLQLLVDNKQRDTLGENAKAIMAANRGASVRTVEMIKGLIAA